MRIHILHISRYRYPSAVQLLPHTLRLRPREEPAQKLLSHRIEVLPEQHHQSYVIDADSNLIERVWFEGTSPRLEIRAESMVETLRENPFDFILDEEAMQLPLKTDTAPKALLASLMSQPSSPKEKKVSALASELLGDSKGATLDYLLRCVKVLHAFRRISRTSGDAWAPGETLQEGEGSCRDLTVLFLELCRLQGLAARFVSGYFLEHLGRREHELHAWAEVYLPGAGWRGFDAVSGMACGEYHVALCASADPLACAPVEGSFRGAGKSRFEYKVELKGA